MLNTKTNAKARQVSKSNEFNILVQLFKISGTCVGFIKCLNKWQRLQLNTIYLSKKLKEMHQIIHFIKLFMFEKFNLITTNDAKNIYITMLNNVKVKYI